MLPSDPITSCPYCGAAISPLIESGVWRLVCPCGNEWEREAPPTVADLLDQGCAGLPAFRLALFSALEATQ